MDEGLRTKLKDRLVKFTVDSSNLENERKAKNTGYKNVIKEIKRKIDGISRAINHDDEMELIEAFGEFYKDTLGVK